MIVLILIVPLIIASCAPKGDKAHSAVENIQRYGITIKR